MFRQDRSILFLTDLKIGPNLNLTSHWFKFTPTLMLLQLIQLKIPSLNLETVWCPKYCISNPPLTIVTQLRFSCRRQHASLSSHRM